MKALTLHQPWASLMALGYKTIETRGRKTSHRGTLWIHAGLYLDQEAFESFRGLLTAPTLPRGCLLCVVDLYDVKPTSELKADRFGNFSKGRYGWMTRELRVLPEPIPCRGYQTIWTIPDEIEKRLNVTSVHALSLAAGSCALQPPTLGE